MDFPFELLKRYNSLDHSKIRIGRDNDGGYVILDGLNYDLMISCGINNDDSFEHDFLNHHKGVSCLAYDGTVNDIPNFHDRIQFVKKNISNENSDFLTNLHDVVGSNNNIFLKMDIEGSEYPWLHCMPKKYLRKMSQIVIEFHSKCCGIDYFTPYTNSAFESLLGTHYLVHLHGNNCMSKSLYGEKEVFIGTSKTSKKIIHLDKEYPPSTTFKMLEIPYLKKPCLETFSFELAKDKLIVQRTDIEDGWRYSHTGIINGNEIPSIFEATFVLKSLLPNVVENMDSIPSKLDQANKPSLKEIELSGYPYSNL
jgi:hypothetical protein